MLSVYLLFLDIIVILRGEIDCVTKIGRWRLTGAKLHVKLVLSSVYLILKATRLCYNLYFVRGSNPFYVLHGRVFRTCHTGSPFASTKDFFSSRNYFNGE